MVVEDYGDGKLVRSKRTEEPGQALGPEQVVIASQSPQMASLSTMDLLNTQNFCRCEGSLSPVPLFLFSG